MSLTQRQKDALDRYLTTPPEERFWGDEDDQRPYEIEPLDEVKEKVRRTLGDLQVGKEINDPYLIKRSKARLALLEQELCLRRRERKVRRGNKCQLHR